jgi:serine/threonine protein kinase/predicted Zn-dependent protease
MPPPSPATEATQVLPVEPAVRMPSGVTETPPPKGVGEPRRAEPTNSFPVVGDELFGFVLTEVIGSGGFGRVFLARQRSLADRPVALKVSAGADAEAQNLARLQHTNIMPIHSVHKAGGLVGVCMPYYGRMTLADLCSSLDSLRALPQSGDHVVSTLCARRDTTHIASGEQTPLHPVDSPPPPAAAVPQLARLRTMSYVDAVLWLVRGIASGLAHAHDRGVIHRDMKPANVLLADDGQPLVLDFNLAVGPTDSDGCRGGTLPYMSPEQLRCTDGRDVRIDHRTDIYSLGVMTAQLLSGRFPFPVPKTSSTQVVRRMLADRLATLPRFRGGNQAVSPAVEAIVHKCLAADPAHRYQSAADLIEDLERHQGNLPLRFAANTSVRERLAKWARRHPRLTSPPAVAAAVAGVLLAGTSGVGWGLLNAERAGVARAAERGRDVADEFDRLHGPAEQYLTAHNGNPHLLARGKQAGWQALDTLAARLGDDWQSRAEFRTLLPSDRDRLTARAGELAFLLAQAGDAGGRHTAAFDRLADTAGASGRVPVLRAAELHSQGKFRESLPGLLDYCKAHPDDAGGWFLLGRAHSEVGRDDDAYLAYSAAIALRPRYAPGYYFRAGLADRLKKADPTTGRPQALSDTDRAVELDPEFADARLLRAQLRYQLNLLADARADLDDLLRQPEPTTRGWLLRALVREKQGDRTGAAADREAGLKADPRTAADFIARGVARRKADPTAALEDFRAAATADPLATAPLEHQAYVQAEVLKKPADAADTLAALLDRTPQSPLPFISRAVYLARAGKTDEAVGDAKRAEGLSESPAVRYRVACVYALAAKADARYAPLALKHLSAALKGGFGYEHLPTDTDLDPLRGRAEFERLSELTKLLTSLATSK